MSSENSTPVYTRGRKGSAKETAALSLSDISKLLRESETRIKSDMQQLFQQEMTVVTEKLAKIESRFSFLHEEIVRVDKCMVRMQELIIDQQLQIEQHERRMRESNLIVHNIPEEDLSSNKNSLKDDHDKVDYLLSSANAEVTMRDVVSIHRIGQKKRDTKLSHRPIKIEFKDKNVKYRIMNKRREITMNDALRQIFHNRIFVNCDSSFLVQKEEFRLRKRLKDLKAEDPNASSFIRSGVLYVNGSAVDRVDVSKQLF
jgi:hypothetical protein